MRKLIHRLFHRRRLDLSAPRVTIRIVYADWQLTIN